jgi:hypothetical protein
LQRICCAPDSPLPTKLDPLRRQQADHFIQGQDHPRRQGFASILSIIHLARVVFETVAVLGVFAVDLLTWQVLTRMEKRKRNMLAKAGATLTFPP